MRNRIVCLVLLVALAAPAAGWAKGSVIDPNGEHLRANGGTTFDDEAGAMEPAALAAAALSGPGTEAPARSRGWLSLVYRFLGWLELGYRLA